MDLENWQLFSDPDLKHRASAMPDGHSYSDHLGYVPGSCLPRLLVLPSSSLGLAFLVSWSCLPRLLVVPSSFFSYIFPLLILSYIFPLFNT